MGCAKNKLERRAPARDLYVSELFDRARAVAEQTCDSWLILSAKHGVVVPSMELYPAPDCGYANLKPGDEPRCTCGGRS